ncbi:Rne/Rng family ribonuclease [Kozakia baliensis]|uniref:Rne/Rng family ribonuclease n=1 Tax=Kozakia baliensis TaxID=153496 RepID=UPI00345BA36E
MHKRMLIDTTHAEETRVVVMDGDRLEDYDVETSNKKQLKGNIYLAKVIRVEPSLQAAFVDYGGNRHGFLAFSEIHPDYFQIPVADREKLIALQDEEARAEEARRDSEDETSVAEDGEEDENGASEENSRPEIVGGEHDTGDESAAARRTARFLRNYKIQEVIRRRQVLLVQVVKEERGNKGAALTTYVSLAGRYCVLMPNALRGGGVSRKITSDSDRKRLRDIISALDLPRGMAMIVRTAGAQRPGPEITRDCEYLLQLWDDIRSHTLSSVAPTLVYEEASLIKRAIRDLFSKDIEEIVIDGEPAWKNAREFMRLLMPHNVNKVKLWRDHAQSLFARYQVEGHLDAIFSPTAQLRSGGYIVINQTEALVAIDVNSGRSTGQRNIEDTAVRTNLEAAEEVARQLRLRDLAGLIVIDFIDMESRKHNHMVEKRLKEALRSDRARIQIGQISHFGLLEMSRQRLRPSIAEAVLTPCPYCQGTGYIRGTESAALHILRAIDDEGAQQRAAEIEVHVAPGVALYILNNKRGWLTDIEQRHRMQVFFQADEGMTPSDLRIERVRPQTAPAPEPQTTVPTNVMAGPGPAVAVFEAEREEPQASPSSNEYSEEGQEDQGRRRRRRRRRGGRRNDQRFDDDNGTATPAEYRDHSAVEETEFDNAAAAPAARAPTHEQAEEPVQTQEAAMIMPGRRRTRTRRAIREDRPSRDRQDHDNQREYQYREERQPQNQRPVWVGPTPADPFGGGSFDIFDVIEQAEFEQVSAPHHEPASAPVTPEKVEVHVEPVPQVESSAPETQANETPVVKVPVEEAPVPQAEATEAEVTETPAAATPKPRRRGRPRKTVAAKAEVTEPAPTAPEPADAQPVAEVEDTASETKAAPRRRGRPRKTPAAENVAEVSEKAATTAPKPKSRARSKAKVKEEAPAETDNAEQPLVQPIDVDKTPPAKRRTGWWKR